MTGQFVSLVSDVAMGDRVRVTSWGPGPDGEPDRSNVWFQREVLVIGISETWGIKVYSEGVGMYSIRQSDLNVWFGVEIVEKRSEVLAM